MAPTTSDDGSSHRHRLQRGREYKARAPIDGAEKKRREEESERRMQELARSADDSQTPPKRRRASASASAPSSSSSSEEADFDGDGSDLTGRGRLVAKLKKDGGKFSAESFWGSEKGGSNRVVVRVKVGGGDDDSGDEAGSKLSPAEMADFVDKKKTKKRKMKVDHTSDIGDVDIDSDDVDDDEMPWRKPKKTKKSSSEAASADSSSKAIGVSDVVAEDGNFYRCSICHDRGNVLCCDGCPKVFHQGCLSPRAGGRTNEDPWYCSRCYEKKGKRPKINTEAKTNSGAQGDKAKAKMAKWLTKGPTPKKFDDVRKRQTEKVERIKKEEEEKRVAKEKAGIPKKAKKAASTGVPLPKKVKAEPGKEGAGAGSATGRKDGGGGKGKSLISSMPPPPAGAIEQAKQAAGVKGKSLISSMAPPPAANAEVNRQARPPFGSDRRYPQARPWQQQQQQMSQPPPSSVKPDPEQQQQQPTLQTSMSSDRPATPTAAEGPLPPPPSSAPQAAASEVPQITPARKLEIKLGAAVDAVVDLCTRSDLADAKVESPPDHPTPSPGGYFDRSSSKGRSSSSSQHIKLDGSFANGREEKYDFFDHDAGGRVVLQSRIPIFPEDFEPGQKEWPLSWWGIVEPSKELLEEHEKGYPALTEILEGRKEQERYEDELVEYNKKMREYEAEMNAYERQYGPQRPGPPLEQLGPFGGPFQGRDTGACAGPPFPLSQGQGAYQGHPSVPGDRAGQPPPRQGFSEQGVPPPHQQQQQNQGGYGQRDAQGESAPQRRDYEQRHSPPRGPPSHSQRSDWKNQSSGSATGWSGGDGRGPPPPPPSQQPPQQQPSQQSPQQQHPQQQRRGWVGGQGGPGGRGGGGGGRGDHWNGGRSGGGRGGPPGGRGDGSNGPPGWQDRGGRGGRGSGGRGGDRRSPGPGRGGGYHHGGGRGGGWDERR